MVSCTSCRGTATTTSCAETPLSLACYRGVDGGAEPRLLLGSRSSSRQRRALGLCPLALCQAHPSSPQTALLSATCDSLYKVSFYAASKELCSVQCLCST